MQNQRESDRFKLNFPFPPLTLENITGFYDRSLSVLGPALIGLNRFVYPYPGEVYIDYSPTKISCYISDRLLDCFVLTGQTLPSNGTYMINPHLYQVTPSMLPTIKDPYEKMLAEFLLGMELDIYHEPVLIMNIQGQTAKPDFLGINPKTGEGQFYEITRFQRDKMSLRKQRQAHTLSSLGRELYTSLFQSECELLQHGALGITLP